MENHVFNYQTLIREFHLDTFGHVNNAVYLQLFEEARWEYITVAGYGLERVHAEQIGPVALEASIKYKKELKLREKITIETRFAGRPNRLSFILEQAIKKEDGKVAATLSITLAIMDFKARKLIAPPEGWLKAMGADLHLSQNS